MFESTPTDKSINTSEEQNLEYYNLLSKNKEHIRELSQKEASGDLSKKKGASNEKKVIDRLKTFKNEKTFTNPDQEFIKTLLSKYRAGDVPPGKSRRLVKLLENQPDQHKAFFLVRSEFDTNSLNRSRKTKTESSSLKTSEVILSKYSIKK